MEEYRTVRLDKHNEYIDGLHVPTQWSMRSAQK